MNRLKFYQLLLLAAWVIFVASEKNMASSIVLMAAGLYATCEIMPKIIKEVRRNAKG